MQPSLLEPALRVPEGFEYRAGFLAADEERALLAAIDPLTFSNVEMRGGVARRRTAHFGWAYGYYSRRTSPGEPLPEFLHGVRARAAAWAGIEPEAFAEALVTEYPAGAPIGWHRDAPMFGDIAGISLGSECRMKFRPYVSPGALVTGAPPRRTTHEIDLEARSAYLIRGLARQQYEHHIPAVDALRYSITFRTLRR
ncbi:MAG: alpha-ketoglutarate-dependent dioxygenase AlkB [Vicinamibacterales bacterium]